MKKLLILLALLAAPLAVSAQVATASLSPKEDAAAFAKMRSKMDRIRRTEHRPTVALVLSGGGAKGAAHVGVLRYLEELQIPVDMVLGTSMGGLVGGLYSLGYDAAYLDSLLTSVDWNLVLSDKVPQDYISYATKMYKDKYVIAVPFHYSEEAFRAMVGGMPPERGEIGGESSASEVDFPINNIARSLPAGYINGLNVNNIFSSMSAGYQDSIQFRDLPIPFCCVASDLVTCKAKNWTAGSITEALRSTMSIPGLFDPVRTHGMVLVDGGTRNNFPTDLAREMGADYVIGVNLSDKDLTYNDINNIADMLWTFIDMLGREAFSKNIGNTDVYIKPDLAEYNMLSFDSESIKIIIGRGYDAAIARSRELKALKAMMPDAKTTLRNRPADDINRGTVQIATIEFDGLKDRESRFLASKIKFAAGDHVDRADIEQAVSMIFATGSFESVTYHLLGSEQPYRLVFKCIKRPIHQLGVGYRADNETLVDVILNVGFNAHRIEGPKLDLTGKLGMNKYAEARFSYDMPRTPTINFLAKVGRSTANLTTDDALYRFKYSGHKEELFFSNMHWTRMDFNLGVRNRYFGVNDWMSNSEVPVSDAFLETLGGDYLSSFVSGRAYTFDDGYFPTKGIDLDLDYEWIMGKIHNPDYLGAHLASLNFRSVVPMGSRTAFLFGVGARAVMNPDGDNDYDDLPHANYIGGNMRGRYLEQQLPFCGFGDVMLVDDYLITANAALRFRFGKSLYTTLQAGAFASEDNVLNFMEPTNPIVLGACLEAAYNTIAGPLKMDVRWNSFNNKVGVYIGFGYDF